MTIEFLVQNPYYNNINDHDRIVAHLDINNPTRFLTKISNKGYYLKSLKEISNHILAISKTKEGLLQDLFKQIKLATGPNSEDLKIIIYDANDNHNYSLIFKIAR